jgi:hypothetical protein
MAKDVSQVLEERWSDYLRFDREGEACSAFVCLAEITQCLNYASLPQQLTQKWSVMIQNVPITDEDMRSVRTAVAQKIRQMQRIVNVGTRFIYEEALLLISVRVELELLSAFLAERGIPMAMDLAAVDDALLAIATSSPANARDFRSAQAAAKQNWGIPLHSRWLEGPTR